MLVYMENSAFENEHDCSIMLINNLSFLEEGQILKEAVMKDLKGSQTEKNLWDAFAGESKARVKYSFFASIAEKEGFVHIGQLFQETSENEREHAKVHFKNLKGSGTTLENLKEAAEGEYYEFTEMYPEFAKIARKEGFDEIAKSFDEIAEVEAKHHERYQKLIKNITEKTVFKRDTEEQWKCLNCGYIHTGKEAPDLCPACKHAKKFFAIREVNY